MNTSNLLQNEWVRYVLIMLVGITIGALFYPTKRIEEKTSQKYEQQIQVLKEQHSKETKDLSDKLDKTEQENKQIKVESDLKISSLTTQISNLKSKQKTSHYKLVKPDGTVEEKDFTESDVDESSQTIIKVQTEFKQKVDEIEQKWSKIHEERTAQLKKEFDSKESDYQRTIASLEKSKTVSINEKHFALEVGMMSDRDYYGHTTADLWGPFFLGMQVEIKTPTSSDGAENRFGLGLGLRF